MKLIYADSNTLSTDFSTIRIQIVETLPNGVSVETLLENGIPKNVLTELGPESLRVSVQDSTLLISYDARVSEDLLTYRADVEEMGKAYHNELLNHLGLFVVFATGLVLLTLEMFSNKVRKENIIGMIEKGEKPPRGAVVSEESLLLLSSKNPEAYVRALDMVLKGELRVKGRRFENLREKLSSLKKLVKRRI
jgi:hypothetical protein